jgi:hypothetical protein
MHKNYNRYQLSYIHNSCLPYYCKCCKDNCNEYASIYNYYKGEFHLLTLCMPHPIDYNFSKYHCQKHKTSLMSILDYKTMEAYIKHLNQYVNEGLELYNSDLNRLITLLICLNGVIPKCLFNNMIFPLIFPILFDNNNNQ